MLLPGFWGHVRWGASLSLGKCGSSSSLSVASVRSLCIRRRARRIRPRPIPTHSSSYTSTTRGDFQGGTSESLGGPLKFGDIVFIRPERSVSTEGAAPRFPRDQQSRRPKSEAALRGNRHWRLASVSRFRGSPPEVGCRSGRGTSGERSTSATIRRGFSLRPAVVSLPIIVGDVGRNIRGLRVMCDGARHFRWENADHLRHRGRTGSSNHIASRLKH